MSILDKSYFRVYTAHSSQVLLLLYSVHGRNFIPSYYSVSFGPCMVFCSFWWTFMLFWSKLYSFQSVWYVPKSELYSFLMYPCALVEVLFLPKGTFWTLKGIIFHLIPIYKITPLSTQRKGWSTYCRKRKRMLCWSIYVITFWR